MRNRNAPLTRKDIPGLAWEKMDGLIPAIAQDHVTGEVLMLGYMSPEALAATLGDGQAAFFSRSRQALWRKGDASGHRLDVKAVHADCDGDALLLLAEPAGPTCHLGTASCFSAGGPPGAGWLGTLARIVRERSTADPRRSYTARLVQQGPLRIAQKVGEEGVELALAGAARGEDACIEEAADLLYHLTVLMEVRGLGWEDVFGRLKDRHGQERPLAG